MGGGVEQTNRTRSHKYATRRRPCEEDEFYRKTKLQEIRDVAADSGVENAFAREEQFGRRLRIFGAVTDVVAVVRAVESSE